MKLRSALCFAAVAVSMFMAPRMNAQSAVTPFIGEIRYVAFNFAPQGWALCDGQLLSIAENVTLFTLLGTNYGGDGKSSFGLPNLQGRVALGEGAGTAGTTYFDGQTGGQETVTLTVPQLPAHTHTLRASNSTANSKGPADAVLANTSTAATYTSQAPDVAMNSKAIGVAGQSKPVPTMPPFQTLTCIIALQGIFPTAN